jgi:fumarate reductase subunit C
MERRLFALQRLSAMVMAPFVLVHLGLILYAVRGGLTAAEILSRTQGSVVWIGFYTLFVLSVAVHVPIRMLRNILIEWLHVGRRASAVLCLAFGVLLLLLGLRAVAAVGGLAL